MVRGSDRGAITTHFSAERAEGWVTPEKLEVQVGLDNLFGTPAVFHIVDGMRASNVRMPEAPDSPPAGDTAGRNIRVAVIP